MMLLPLALLLLVHAGPLQDYVAKPDPNYSWEIVDEKPFLGGVSFIIQLTSQQWPPQPALSSQSLWKHWLTINIPDQPKSSTDCFLSIRGGSNPGGKPSTNTVLVNMTTAFGAITAELLQIPNQPLTLCNEKPRVEDALISFTWRHFFRYSDPNWLLRFPMVKAAVRAMDTINTLSQQKLGTSVTRFTVSGASKRGWVTWLTPVVDKRVVAIVPMVIDVLNFQKNLNHHWQVYGGWSFALQDYVDANVTNYLNTQACTDLMKILDPIAYPDALTIPKYIISAAGDEFFVPESSTFYFDQLPGIKYHRICPNSGHNVQGIGLEIGIANFWKSIIDKVELPTVNFRVIANGDSNTIINYTRTGGETFNQTTVLLWSTNNPKARDFRNYPVKPLWQPANIGNARSLAVRVVPPNGGYSAFFLEVTFRGPPYTEDNSIRFTSDVVVLPSALPFPPCTTQCNCGDSCAPPFPTCPL